MFFASSIFSINKNRRFCHDIYFYVVYFILLLFSGKMVIQKTQKRMLFSFPFKNKFQRFAFTYLTKNHS